MKNLKMFALALYGFCLGAVKDHCPEGSPRYERWEDRQGRVIEKLEKMQR